MTGGVGPFDNGGVVLWNDYVNGSGCPNNPGPATVNPTTPDTARRPTDGPNVSSAPVIVKKIELDPRQIEELVCERKIKYLDVYIQDDQVIDSMRLVITKP